MKTGLQLCVGFSFFFLVFRKCMANQFVLSAKKELLCWNERICNVTMNSFIRSLKQLIHVTAIFGERNSKNCSMGFKPSNPFSVIWLKAMTTRLKPRSKLPGILPKPINLLRRESFLHYAPPEFTQAKAARKAKDSTNNDEWCGSISIKPNLFSQQLEIGNFAHFPVLQFEVSRSGSFSFTPGPYCAYLTQEFSSRFGDIKILKRVLDFTEKKLCLRTNW